MLCIGVSLKFKQASLRQKRALSGAKYMQVDKTSEIEIEERKCHANMYSRDLLFFKDRSLSSNFIDLGLRIGNVSSRQVKMVYGEYMSWPLCIAESQDSGKPLRVRWKRPWTAV